MKQNYPLNEQPHFYRDKRFYISLLIALGVTIVGEIISAMTTDFGFKTYWGAMIFFPYEMLSTLIYGVIPIWIGILSFFQYLPYGVLAWLCWRKHKWQPFIILILIHLMATGLSFATIRYGKDRNEIILIEQAK